MLGYHGCLISLRRIVASIEEPKAIQAILAHFAKHGALEAAHYPPGPRGPPADVA
jgi:hypothetical protein